MNMHQTGSLTINDVVDSEKQLGQTIMEAPNDYEGTANIVHHDYQ